MSDVQTTAGRAHRALLALLVHGTDCGCVCVLCAERDNGRRSRDRLEGELAEKVLEIISGRCQKSSSARTVMWLMRWSTNPRSGGSWGQGVQVELARDHLHCGEGERAGEGSIFRRTLQDDVLGEGCW